MHTRKHVCFISKMKRMACNKNFSRLQISKRIKNVKFRLISLPFVKEIYFCTKTRKRLLKNTNII